MTEALELSPDGLRAERTTTGDLTGSWFCELADGVEVLVPGVDNNPSLPAMALANRVLPHRNYLLSRAVQLLEAFMRDRGIWHLVTVDFAQKAQQQQCHFVFSLGFEADRDPYDYGYTYFDVCFMQYDNPPKSDAHGRPIKFVVGFH